MGDEQTVADALARGCRLVVHSVVLPPHLAAWEREDNP